MSDSTDGQIDVDALPSGTGCRDCDFSGGWWVHLRRCAACGHVGCCDSSPGQHATKHASDTGHRFMQSFEPGEDWFFDYMSQQLVDGPPLAEPSSHPDGQGVPAPKDRVPANWMELIHR